MFFISAIVLVAFVGAGALAPTAFKTGAEATRTWIETHLGWVYILAGTFFVLFAFWLMLSRVGKIRLGPDSSRPEFSTGAWFAMLFTTGMGIGLVFYGVAEPTYHRMDPAVIQSSPEPATGAMQYTLFHWGLHPWAIYISLGAALGYFCFRKGLPMRPAAALYPLIGNRIYGWIGHIVDILAVFGTLFGLATSLGLGTLQINSGLNTLFGVPNNQLTQTLLICFITAVALASVLFGIDKGIRRLSVINIWLAGFLMVFVFFLGSAPWMISLMVTGTAEYLQNLVGMSLSFPSSELNADANTFTTAWTVFYWGWWLSWSPFVGMFLARISYGRTLRQFVTGTLFAPVGVSVVWFGVFGGSGLLHDIQAEENGGALIGDLDDEADAMYMLLESFQLTGGLFVALGALAVLVIALFFITSSDSGSLVIDILTNGGDPNPLKIQRAGWAITEGLVTIVLLVIGSETAIEGLQAASVASGLPFGIVLVFITIGLIKALKQENVTEYTPMVSNPTGYSGNPGGAAGENVPNPGPDSGAAAPVSNPRPNE